MRVSSRRLHSWVATKRALVVKQMLEMIRAPDGGLSLKLQDQTIFTVRQGRAISKKFVQLRKNCFSRSKNFKRNNQYSIDYSVGVAIRGSCNSDVAVAWTRTLETVAPSLGPRPPRRTTNRSHKVLFRIPDRNVFRLAWPSHNGPLVSGNCWYELSFLRVFVGTRPRLEIF